MTAGRNVTSENKDWGTPKKYVNAITHFFGGEISLDPCSNRHSIVNAKTEYSLPNNDGLKDSWKFPTIYANPPYGADRKHQTTIRDWLRRCEEANRLYGSEVVALVPVATNTSHWKNFVYGRASAICFLYDTRLKFLENGNDSGKGAPMSCALIYWGPRYKAFFDTFISYGAVVSIENLRGVQIGEDSNNHQLRLSIP